MAQLVKLKLTPKESQRVYDYARVLMNRDYKDGYWKLGLHLLLVRDQHSDLLFYYNEARRRKKSAQALLAAVIKDSKAVEVRMTNDDIERLHNHAYNLLDNGDDADARQIGKLIIELLGQRSTLLAACGYALLCRGKGRGPNMADILLKAADACRPQE